MCDLPETWKSTHPHCAEKVKVSQCFRCFWILGNDDAIISVDGSVLEDRPVLRTTRSGRKSMFFHYLFGRSGESLSSSTLATDFGFEFEGYELRKYSLDLFLGVLIFETAYYELQAEPQFDLGGLFALMKDNPANFKWIQMRIERLWPRWVRAFQTLEDKQNWTLSQRPRRRVRFTYGFFYAHSFRRMVSAFKVLLHLGLLTKESGFKFGEKSLKGGPLGELVQWSDLIASLYILGHDIVISSEILTFTR